MSTIVPNTPFVPKLNSRLFGPFRGTRLVGPAVIVLAFGQASGELIHWPYLTVKYGGYYLFLLIPACLIQYPMFTFLARQTVLSGESFLSLLFRSARFMAIITWIVFAMTTLWVAGYTSAGGVALTKFINTCAGTQWDAGRVGIYVAMGINTFYFLVLVFARDTYRRVATLMTVFALLSVTATTALFLWAVYARPPVPNFWSNMLSVKASHAPTWVASDWKILISAIVFAGVGGLWNMLYSEWVRNERLGMASVDYHPFRSFREQPPDVSGSEESRSNYRVIMNRVRRDLIIGLLANTTIIIMLSYVAASHYQATDGLAPAGTDIITTVADAVWSSGAHLWGGLFYVLIGLFLIDTWLTAADALAKTHGNFLLRLRSPGTDSNDVPADTIAKVWYLGCLALVWAVTFVTAIAAQPQELIYLIGVLSAFGGALLVVGLAANEQWIRRRYPEFRTPRLEACLLCCAFLVCAGLSVAYLMQ